MFVYLYNQLTKFKSSKGSVDSDPGLSQSRFYVYDLFELDVTFQVICLMSELESSDILIQLMSDL